ncbi:MAG: FGGY family carbohydrate kinase [Clostridiales bacterium]|nr:FGGY family carbohydrate kinase [Clostridiales bacterium]
MFINDAMKRTGLTKKAIRFYEDKGLLSVQRQINGYRSYSEDNILTLKKIKMLRSCGVSVSDIKLLFGNMITVEELLIKRKKEVENEYGYYSGMFEDISNVFQNYKKGQYDLDVQFNETTYNSFIPSDTLILGIDIGTTSISAVVIDIENKTNIETYTLDNAAGIKSSNPCFNEQNTMIIYDKVIKLVELIVTGYPGIKAIGVTGQMHGIVYIDKKGDAVSPLVTWQDKRADEMLENSCTYCEKIFEVTKERIYTGFGFATHYYNLLNQLVPSDAYSFCSIMDYIVMKLTNQCCPLIHV